MISFNEIQLKIKDNITKNSKDVIQGDVFDVFVPEYYSEGVMISAISLAIAEIVKITDISAIFRDGITRGWLLADSKKAYRLKDDINCKSLTYTNTLALSNAFELTLKYYNFKLFSALHSGQHSHAKVFYNAALFHYYSLSSFNVDELNGLWMGVILRYAYDIYTEELKKINNVKTLFKRPSEIWIDIIPSLINTPSYHTNRR